MGKKTDPIFPLLHPFSSLLFSEIHRKERKTSITLTGCCCCDFFWGLPPFTAVSFALLLCVPFSRLLRRSLLSSPAFVSSPESLGHSSVVSPPAFVPTLPSFLDKAGLFQLPSSIGPSSGLISYRLPVISRPTPSALCFELRTRFAIPHTARESSF